MQISKSSERKKEKRFTDTPFASEETIRKDKEAVKRSELKGVVPENANDPTPETNPEIFLRGLGFSGDLPEEGSEEKPVVGLFK